MIYVVSGFWRSGTSLVMQACEAGGLPVHRSAQRDELNEQHADADYRPNPVSLYEPSGDELRTVGFPRQYDGQAVKILAGWPMAVHQYRVVVLRRDPIDIVESAARAFGEHTDKATQDRWIAEYPARFTEHVRSLTNRRDVETLITIFFEDLFTAPTDVFERLYTQGWPLSVKAAAAVVRPDLRRVGVGAR